MRVQREIPNQCPKGNSVLFVSFGSLDIPNYNVHPLNHAWREGRVRCVRQQKSLKKLVRATGPFFLQLIICNVQPIGTRQSLQEVEE